jgi:hypothetical protein
MGIAHRSWLWAALAPAPGSWLENGPLLLGVVGAGVLVALVVVALLRRKNTKTFDTEAGMGEDLGTYSPPPSQQAPNPLTFQGLPLRLRLVVLAPVGRRTVAGGAEAEHILEQVVRGMGQAAAYDQPKVRIWPLGLSNAAFAPIFFRRVQRPQPAGSPSNWILLAGQASAGAQTVHLGLALWSEELTQIGNRAVGRNDWNDLLRVNATV